MNAREAAYVAVDSVLHRAVESRLVRGLFSLFTFPSSSTELLTPGLRSWLRSAGVALYLVTFALLLGANAIWAAVDGRFVASQVAGERNLASDWPNLVNYTLICPLYVTFGLAFVVHAQQLRSSLRATGLWGALGIEPPAPRRPGLRLVIASAVVLVASLVSLSHYFEEVRRYPFVYWFQSVSSHGERVLNSHGYYYLLTNLLLNLVVMAVIVAHFEMFAVASLVGRAIHKASSEPVPAASPLLQKARLPFLFRPFSSLYAVSKVFVVMILANLYTWRAARPQFVGTLEVTILVAALLGAGSGDGERRFRRKVSIDSGHGERSSERSDGKPGGDALLSSADSTGVLRVPSPVSSPVCVSQQ